MNDTEEQCILGKQPGIECTAKNCYRCGWEKEEAARRKRQLEEEGLTLCDDGLHRLIIKG